MMQIISNPQSELVFLVIQGQSAHVVNQCQTASTQRLTGKHPYML